MTWGTVSCLGSSEGRIMRTKAFSYESKIPEGILEHEKVVGDPRNAPKFRSKVTYSQITNPKEVLSSRAAEYSGNQMELLALI